MAKATWVPLTYLVERGQQIKVFSQLTKKAREMGYLVPALAWGEGMVEGYEGATVLEAQKGAYYTPITALDFEALYPSIMMAHNLCYSSLVPKHLAKKYKEDGLVNGARGYIDSVQVSKHDSSYVDVVWLVYFE